MTIMVNFTPEQMEQKYSKNRIPIVGKCRLCGRPIPEYYTFIGTSAKFAVDSLKRHELCLFADPMHLSNYVQTRDPAVIKETSYMFKKIGVINVALHISSLIFFVILIWIDLFYICFPLYVLEILFQKRLAAYWGSMYARAYTSLRSQILLMNPPNHQINDVGGGTSIEQPIVRPIEQPIEQPIDPISQIQVDQLVHSGFDMKDKKANAIFCTFCGANIEPNYLTICPVCGEDR
jgi:hypothetical protein